MELGAESFTEHKLGKMASLALDIGLSMAEFRSVCGASPVLWHVSLLGYVRGIRVGIAKGVLVTAFCETPIRRFGCRESRPYL